MKLRREFFVQGRGGRGHMGAFGPLGGQGAPAGGLEEMWGHLDVDSGN